MFLTHWGQEVGVEYSAMEKNIVHKLSHGYVHDIKVHDIATSVHEARFLYHQTGKKRATKRNFFQ